VKRKSDLRLRFTFHVSRFTFEEIYGRELEPITNMPVYNSIGKFKIKSILGGGGMGRVFLAENVAEGREIALKLVPAEDDAAMAERWGAVLTQQLDHPGVVRVYSFGEIDGHFFVEMEYVVGKTLRRFLQEEGVLPVERACRLAIQTCDVLAAAHAFRGDIDGKSLSGIIHGDLSWSNLLVQPDDRIKIIDFGVADALSVTRSWKTVKGQTPNFAAPEQLKPGEMRVESDIWAVGVLLYIMLTDRLPFNRTAEKSTEERILHDRPMYPENVPAELAAIIGRALQKSYPNRYPSAAEMKVDLAAFLEGRAIGQTTTSQPPAFCMPGEVPEIDGERTQRTERHPGPDREVRADAEATQRTSPVPSPALASESVTAPLPGTSQTPMGKAVPLRPKRPGLRKAFIASLTILMALFVVAFTIELGVLKEAQEARERFEANLDDAETSWQKYESLKKKDYLKFGLLKFEAALKNGLVERGEKVLNRARDPNFTPYKEDWQEAVYYFDYARRLPPRKEASEARYNFASGMIALGSKKKREMARARELFLLATEQDRKWAQPWEALGRMAYESANSSKPKDYTEAIKYFDRAIELKQDWAKPYEGRAWCYLKSNPPRLDEAIKDFEKAEKLGMNIKSVHLGLATALHQRSETEKNPILAEMDQVRAEEEYERAGVEFKRENPIVRILKRVFQPDDKEKKKEKADGAERIDEKKKPE
jgi:serine/threonine protein kinase